MQVYYMKNLTVKTKQNRLRRRKDTLELIMQWRMLCFLKIYRRKIEGYFRKSEERAGQENRESYPIVKENNNYYRQKNVLHYVIKKSETRGKIFQHKLSHEIAEAYVMCCSKKILDMKAMSQCMHFGKRSWII